jgi:hypothetical protein
MVFDRFLLISTAVLLQSILGKSNGLKCASSIEPIHKILAHLISRKIDPRAGPFEEQAA